MACSLAIPIGLAAQPETEPNNSPGQANPITEGTPISGELGACSTPDNTADWFQLVSSGNGAIRVQSQMSNSGAAPITVSIDLLNSSGGLVQNLQLNAGGNGLPVLDDAIVDCRGQGTYYVRVNNPSATTCTTYELTVDVLPPVFGPDPEPNNSLGQATLLPIATPLDGQVNFLTYTDNADNYRLETPDDGILNFTLEAEHRGSSPGTLTVTLLNSSGGLLNSYTGVPVGASSIPVTTQLSSLCKGDGLYYLRIDNASCGTSYRLSYTITDPLYAEDLEENDAPTQADTVAAGVDHEGRLDFFYDDNSDYYRLILPSDGILNITVNAEHAGTSTGETLTAHVLNSSGGLVQSHSVNIGANGNPVMTDLATSCLGNEQLYYLRFFNPTACGVSYQFNYGVTPPLYADDLEENDGTSQSDTVAASIDHDGRINFYYDDNTDYFRLILPTDGVLDITMSAEHSGSSTAETMNVHLLNSSGGLIQAWPVSIGSSGSPSSTVLSASCLGNEQLYYLHVFGSTICGVSYRFNYSVTQPVFGDDPEPNNSIGQATGLDLDLGGSPGRLDFFYDNTSDYFGLTLGADGTIEIGMEAENAGAAGTMNFTLLNAFGGLVQATTFPVGGGSTPALGTFTSNMLTAGTYYIRLDNAPCGTSYRFLCNDDDNDGTCNGFDLCPGGPEPGTPCDDLDSTTGNDVILSDCSCAGQLIDCQGNPGGSALPGQDCDDGDPNTSGETWDANCNCTGGLVDDCLGVPGGSALPGTACDDGDPNTTGETWDANCNCTGGLVDDCLGVPGGSALPGTACDDGDPNTSGETWDANCNCVGTPAGSELVTLEITLDDFGSETTWAVYDATGNTVITSGGPYADGQAGTVITEQFFLPQTCYELVVSDGGSNGITDGGYVLYDGQGRRIIVAGGLFGATSQIANGNDFCLPLSGQGLIASWCDRTDLPFNGSAQIYASTQPGATAYTYWLFDPHGSYSRKVTLSSTVLKPTYLQTNPVPADIDLNVRIRALVGGNFTEYGRACVVRLNSAAASFTAREQLFDVASGTVLTMWPNPNREDVLFLKLEGLEAEMQDITIDIHDLFGKRVFAQELDNHGEVFNHAIDLGQHIAPGVYLVNIRVNDRLYTQRLVRQ